MFNYKEENIMIDKKLSRREFLRLAALTAGGAALAACGQAEETPATEEEPGEAPASTEKVTIRMWSHQNTAFVTANEQLVKKYMDENPNVEITSELPL
jgi:ABC-type glycerol-3-phosphate transport system substrate-binding protein